MSAPTSEASALPVTGSGPFTLAIGLIGAAAILIGGIMRRVSRHDDDQPSVAAFAGPVDLMTDLSGTGTPAPVG